MHGWKATGIRWDIITGGMRAIGPVPLMWARVGLLPDMRAASTLLDTGMAVTGGWNTIITGIANTTVGITTGTRRILGTAKAG